MMLLRTAEKPCSVIYPEFSCRKNYTLDRKMIFTSLNGLDLFYHHTKWSNNVRRL